MREPLCRGCKTRSTLSHLQHDYYEVKRCLISHNSPKKIKDCPCQKCIIAGMCEDQCEDFYNLLVSIYRMELFYNYKKYTIEQYSYGTSRPYPQRRSP